MTCHYEAPIQPQPQQPPLPPRSIFYMYAGSDSRETTPSKVCAMTFPMEDYDETPDRIRLLSIQQPQHDDHFLPSTAPHASHPNSQSTMRRSSSAGAIHTMIASTLARRVGRLYAASTAIILISVVVLLLVDAREYRTRPDFTAFYSAAVVVICTVWMSTQQIYRQLTHWFMPDVQKFVVRILWMVPLFSIQSWCSLRFKDSRIYIDAVRDLYEAFVIQSFVYYLIELLGGEDSLIAKLRANDPHHSQHQSVFSLFFGSWEMGRPFLLYCKYGVLQYVVLKCICTIATVILEEFGLYGEGSYSFASGYLYISTVINISQCWALYCLIKLFHATADDLRSPKNWHPLGKFLCVKGVVFFTWWQSLGIFFLKANGIIGGLGNWDADEVANGLQDYLISVEMLGFAVAHGITFTEKEYLPAGYGDHADEDGMGRHFSGTDNDRVGLLSFREEMEYRENNEAGGGEEYQPPTIRTLHSRGNVSDAFWSATLPKEALDDIRRLRKGVSNQVQGGDLDDRGLIISMTVMDEAEVI